ncbi:hypothetical protein B0A50_08157 [Salinomyces thailandicus]|uniref:DUF155 domain-containing protein n=1 Tax=Salinomyces thailandicus TaxID=706561 RepID=A0A4U0TKC0_9PEZI|nr:hypothetical protein B0A50_08157 [Salinomyces thailandica]
MASARHTWIAFGAVVRGRGLVSRRSCAQHTVHQPHQILTNGSNSAHITSQRFSTTTHQGQGDGSKKSEQDGGKEKTPKRKAAARIQTSPTSLRRVALEAQRSSKVIKGRGKRAHVDPEIETKDVTAYCAAETYNLHIAKHVLQQEGYEPDPYSTDLFPQVLHVQTPNFLVRDEATGENKAMGAGDVFVFPSGSVVTWNVSEKLAHHIVERVLAPKAAEEGHLDRLEAEDLAYVEDATREHSKIVGDTIILGTKATSSEPQHHTVTSSDQGTSDSHEDGGQPRREVDDILAKIAFSSALARSTKLAVLENMLSNYFETTRSIPITLSKGSKLKFGREFILRKTGELLHIRAQLNLYSELTDSLPDLFWDSPHELGLETYYEQVGRALDVGVRIKTLNERMDYASEIAAVLRERLSEKHSTELEWYIIILIVFEVAFEIYRLSSEWREHKNSESTEALTREWLLKELRKA